MVEWNVSLNGGYVDTVFFSSDCDMAHVLDSLINHDGYDVNIKVTASNKRECKNG
jgi:hypothetical protein